MKINPSTGSGLRRANNEKLRVALVHDYLKEIGGAERVLMTLSEMFPDAPIYTAYAFPKFWGQFKEMLSKKKIIQSWGRWLPFLPKFISYYTVFSPWFFSKMDLTQFDLVIVSATGGYFPNGVKIGSKTKLVTYCHTPPRFLYGYPTATKEREKWYFKYISLIVNVFLRQVDYRWAQRPHMFIANSKNVAQRIWKFYRRESKVVYPPIDNVNNESRITNHGENYYLVLARIVGSKNIELAIELAQRHGVKIKIAGRPIGKSGEELVKLIKRSSDKGLVYLGEVTDEERAKLMAGAKALLCLETDADFGMTPIEAQMFGTPVIAYRGGGYLETVVENETGVFFGGRGEDKDLVESLYEAVLRLEKLKFDPKKIVKHATGFSKDRFVSEMMSVVEKVVGEKA